MAQYWKTISSSTSQNILPQKHKRTFNQMIENYGTKEINKRLDVLKFDNYNNKRMKFDFEEDSESISTEANNSFSCSSGISTKYSCGKNENYEKNREVVILQKREYDEEKEKKWVERYYKIQNEKLNKLRFGI